MILTSEREVPARNERGVRGMRAREASVPPASKLKLCSHRPYPSPSTEGKVIGVDLGLKHFAITRDGTKVSKYDNPRHLAPHEKNLKRKQQKLARKQKGSNSRHKYRKTVSSDRYTLRQVGGEFPERYLSSCYGHLA